LQIPRLCDVVVIPDRTVLATAGSGDAHHVQFLW
jgi:hypothetical protein